MIYVRFTHSAPGFGVGRANAPAMERDSPTPAAEPDPEWDHCLEVARSTGLEAIRLTPEDVRADLIGSMPLEVLINYKLLPLSRTGFEITLAMADPLDVVGEDIIRQITGCRVLRVVAKTSEIMAALQGNLGPPESVIESLLQRIPDLGGITYLEVPTEDEAPDPATQLEEQGPVIQLVNSIIGDAIRMGASDIHVEPQKESLRVRYRIDGSLRVMMELPKRVQSACLSRLKLMAGIDISESRKPQDGRARVRVSGREIDLRVSSLPTFRGERVVLRILDTQAVVVQIDQLGFAPADYAKLNDVLQSSQGLVLCTGPTGSGKTSTLYSALVRLNEVSDNIITVEDPVEYQLGGISQVQVHVRAGLTFAAALRSILRQDPDIVLIGEIRDLETAEIAVQAAQTGHLVLSTLHTNDALSTVSRLVLMGVAPYMLASSLLCIIAQRLVRRLCPHCCRAATPTEGASRILALASLTPPSQVKEAVGCDKCHHVGYKGRLGLFEILQVTDRVRELLLAGAAERELEVVARQEGMHSLLEDGLSKCAQGHTSLEEVLKVITVRQAGGRVCPACTASTPGELPICVYCGYELERLCPDCQYHLLPNWLFCPGCKRALAAEQASPTRPAGGSQRIAYPAAEPETSSIDPALPCLLLVTSDPELGQRLAHCLDQRKYRLMRAASAVEARQQIGHQVPDVILLDFDTPGLETRSFVNDLHSRAETAKTPVILFTEPAPGGLQGLDSGADEMLLKPVDESRLQARIMQVLGSG